MLGLEGQSQEDRSQEQALGQGKMCVGSSGPREVRGRLGGSPGSLGYVRATLPWGRIWQAVVGHLLFHIAPKVTRE